MPERETAEAGWFPDPWRIAQFRYWDGTQWTGHVHTGPGAGGNGTEAPTPTALTEEAPGSEPSSDGSARGASPRASCACREPDAPRGEVERTVTLVHGTFAPHAKWVQSTGMLTRALSEIPNTVIRPFCWSGRNRQSDRILAGRELHDQLVDLVARYPGREHHVVGHSHGGNVALYAMRDDSGGIDPLLRGVHITTLSTPFVAIERRRLSRSAGLFVFLTIVSLFPLLVLLPVSIGFVASGAAGIARTFSMLPAIGLVVVVAILAPLFISPLFSYTRGEKRPPYFARLFGRSVEREIATINLPHLDPERLSVYRSPGDEATGVLGLSQLLTWVARHTLAVAAIPTAIAIPLLPVLATANDPVAAAVLALAGILYAFVVTMAILLFGVHVGIGWDTTFLAPHAQIYAEASPPGLAIVHMLKTPPGALAHGLYGSEELVSDLAARIRVGRHLPD